jgi:hypothetical protein
MSGINTNLKKEYSMKKNLVVALGLTVLATPAFATKARLEALGENVNGSFIVQDNRNIFYNAAHVNTYRDLVTYEWGDTQSADSASSPRAEGGIFRTMGNLVWGVQLGNSSNISNAFRLGSGVTALEQNNIDLFVGGDAGVKWGASVAYSSSDNMAATGKQSAIRSRLGVIAGDLEAWANINISNKAESTTPPAAGSLNREFEGKLGYNLGAIYNFQGYRLFADYQSLEGESKGAVAGPLANGDISAKQLQVGAGRVARLNDRATLFTRVQYTMRDTENASFAALTGQAQCSADVAVACSKFKGSFVPVVVGMEYDATSWLALRGSLSQTIWGNQELAGTKTALDNTTAVAAGASVRFGEFSVDASLNSNNFGRVSAIYNF